MSFDGGTCDSWGLVGGIAIGYGFALLNIAAVMVVTWARGR